MEECAPDARETVARGSEERAMQGSSQPSGLFMLFFPPGRQDPREDECDQCSGGKESGLPTHT